MDDTVTLLLVDRDQLGARGELQRLVRHTECCLCGGGPMMTADGVVYDGAPAVCWTCGAVDMWSCDTETPAYLAGCPDEDNPIRVLRERFVDGGRAEWEERARNVDHGIRWLVDDGGEVTPLLADEVPDAR